MILTKSQGDWMCFVTNLFLTTQLCTLLGGKQGPRFWVGVAQEQIPKQSVMEAMSEDGLCHSSKLRTSGTHSQAFRG